MAERDCPHCGDPFEARHEGHRYCSAACRRQAEPGRSEASEPESGSVVEATNKALKAATHLTDMDAGAVATLRVLARKLDALDSDVVTEDDVKGKFDNVTIPTYLKFCESLGLTPAGRSKLAEKPKEAAGGKLGKLRAVPRPGQSA